MQLDDILEELSRKPSVHDIERKKGLVRTLRRLENDPAWVYICRVIHDQVARLDREIARNPPEEMKDILAQQRQRGMVEAYEILSALPRKLQEDLITELDLTEEEVRDL